MHGWGARAEGVEVEGMESGVDRGRSEVLMEAKDDYGQWVLDYDA